jgi:hypothetical protein
MFRYPPDLRTSSTSGLGTGFSVDTPINVARYGIDSVMSVVDDDCWNRPGAHSRGRDFRATAHPKAGDHRAERTRAYLDLVGALVDKSFAAVRNSFPDGRKPRKYFDRSPDCPGTRGFPAAPICRRAQKSRPAARLKRSCAPAGRTSTS